MTEPTTPPTTPADEMVERVAQAIAASDENDWTENLTDDDREQYRTNARAALAALAPELNQADLTVRDVALKVRDARQAQRDLTPDEVDEAIQQPYKVVMK